MPARLRFLSMSSAFAIAAVQPTVSHAQVDTGAPAKPASVDQATSSAWVGEIIVTAQKRSERLADVPMSITAADATQLRSRGVVNTDDLVKLVPGFSFQKSTFGLPVYFIRGVGFSDTSLGVAPAVTVYTDQIPLPFTTMARGAILDLERVEVLKGPQGTLFGQNSTGGAINYIAAKPTKDLSAGFSITGGRFDEIDAEAYLSGQITDTLTARVAVRREYQGDWQRNYTNGETLGAKDFLNGRLLVDWKPAEAARFELSVSGWRDRSDSQAPQFVSYEPGTPMAAGGRPPSYPIASFLSAPEDNRAAAWNPGRDYKRNDKFYQIGLRGDIDITDNITATSLSSYSHFAPDEPQELDGTNYPLGESRIQGRIASFSQELRFAGKIGSKGQWMVGGNFQHDNVNEEQFDGPDDFSSDNIGPLTWDYFKILNHQKITTRSVFGSLDYKITDTLTAQGSVRYTKQDRSYEGCTADDGHGDIASAFGFLSTLVTGTPQSIAPGSCIVLSSTTGAPVPKVKGNLNEDNVSWRGSLNWKPSRSVLLYANVTKGYKAGSFPTLPAAVDSQYAPVKQESVLAYEAGTKISILDRRLDFEGAGFYYDYRDKQLQGYTVIPGFGILPGLVTIPKARILGAEISVNARPLTGLRLSWSGTYIDTKVQSDPVNPIGAFGSVGSFVGQTFPFTPRWQGVADAEYRFHSSRNSDVFFGGSITARTGTKGALLNGSGQSAASERQLLIPGYALVDLRAGVELAGGTMRIEVWGHNVTNRFYVSNAVRAADDVIRYTGTPATYGATLKYKFGS